MLALGKAPAALLVVLLVTACDSGGEPQTQSQPQQSQQAQPTQPTTSEPSPLPPLPPGTQQLPHETVFTVDSIELVTLEKQPAALEIRVKGTARTGGWTDVRLHQLHVTTTPPGVIGFLLVAIRPKGAVTDAITPIEATFILDPLPNDAKQITVSSETNEVTAEIKR
jgi:hypothetical protein